jgi:undecaprenyl-diphosphatase
MDQKTNEYINYNPFWNIKYTQILLLFFSFAIICALTTSGLLKNIDKLIFEYFKNIQRNTQSDLIVIIITTISDTINLIIIGFILVIIKRTRRIGMIFLLSIIIITILVTYIKPLFPSNQIQIPFKSIIELPKKFTLEKDSFMPFDQNYSFPSNHLASATAFSFIIGGIAYKRYPLFAKGFFISFPILIGITKLYLLQQFFSDIIAGSILGLMIITLIIKFTKIEEKEKDKIKEKE